MDNTLERIKIQFHTASEGLRQIDDFYTFKYEGEFGVAFENIHNVKINEKFSSVSLETRSITYANNSDGIELILLSSNLKTHKNEFASLCMQFIEKGQNEENRNIVISNPILWWQKWKELIGNRMYDPKPYSVIAELLTLERLQKLEEKDILWSGPFASSIDIQTKTKNYEVKSSLIRYENEITVSSQFQLAQKEEVNPIFLYYYKMEELLNGETINKVVSRLGELKKVSIQEIEKKLDSLGFPKNASVREKSYVVHEIRKYKINNNFPRITKDSFKDGKIPANIKKIVYTINLDNIEYEKVEQGGFE